MSTKKLKEFDPAQWVTQAEAARLRGVSRQAINNLIKRGKLETLEIGGILFIKRHELQTYVVEDSGRPKQLYSVDYSKQILSLWEKCSEEQKRYIFSQLRREIAIHPIEERLNTQAEIILEAINQDDQGLTFRMLRGVIAEAAFKIEVLDKLEPWQQLTPPGDLPYDYLLSNGIDSVRVQVKLQRSKAGKPMQANEAYRRFSADLFVVETQKTRGGIDPATQENTRPYRFGEFDILAVAMQPSTGSWSSFLYTPANWLLATEEDHTCMLKFQPVSPVPNDDWTNDFETCVEWLKMQQTKQIAS